MVRENEDTGLSREDAVRKAVFDCIEQDVLKEFLETYKWEGAPVRCVKYSVVGFHIWQSLANSQYQALKPKPRG